MEATELISKVYRAGCEDGAHPRDFDPMGNDVVCESIDRVKESLRVLSVVKKMIEYTGGMPGNNDHWWKQFEDALSSNVTGELPKTGE